jgi:hypothetical protein
MELNLKSSESDRVREIINPAPSDRETSLPLTGRVVPFSPAPTGAHAKMAAIINPRTKKGLFSVVDKFFIIISKYKI